MLPKVDEAALKNLIASCGRQLGLCESIERIAEVLPPNLEPAVGRETALSVYGVMVKFGEAERSNIPIDQASGAASRDFAATIERLLWENEEDRCYVQDLQDALREVGPGRRSMSADALDHMLKSVFEIRTRRIELEREILQAVVPRPLN